MGEQTTAEAKTKKKREQETDVQALTKIIAILNRQPKPGRIRVLTWLDNILKTTTADVSCENGQSG